MGKNNKDQEDQGSNDQTKTGKALPKAKPDFTILTEAEHAEKYPQNLVFKVFNRMDRPNDINMCAGRDQHMFNKVDGMKVLNADCPQACLQCPGRSVTHLAPRETRDVAVALPQCFGSAHVNALIRDGHLAVRDPQGNKVAKF